MTLVLVPNTLDARPGSGDSDLADWLPLVTVRTAAGLRHWVAENARSARAFLKRVEALVPLALPLQQVSIVEWPRHGEADAAGLLRPALDGHDLGLLSESGLPALADPGASLVAEAHARGVPVTVLPGPSAISLAVAASGLEGQRFAFVGYVPADGPSREARLRALEADSRRDRATQVMIETPYRNGALLEAMLRTLAADTRLSVAVGLGTDRSAIRTDRVAGFRATPMALPADVPAVFSLLASAGPVSPGRRPPDGRPAPTPRERPGPPPPSRRTRRPPASST
jgi:16S rRNA (cytidine1402-2'-O)-methyltransferase